MLIDLLVGIVQGILNGVLALIPSYSLPELTGFGGQLGSGVATMNGYFPMVTLGACLLVIIGARVAIAAFDLAVFLYGLIPFKAT